MDSSTWENVAFNDGLTAEEVIHLLERPISSGEDSEWEEGPTDIFISPPEANILSDEDSGDEDGGGLIDNLSGRQLSGSAEVKYRNRRVGVNYEFQSYKASQNRKWKEGDLETLGSDLFSNSNFDQYKGMSPVDLFELYFDEEVYENLVAETTRYASFINQPAPQLEPGELKCFIGILLLSGYNILPGKKFYWDTKDDVYNKIVAESMRRDRFIQTMRALHIQDNNKLDPTDKMWKLRPLITAMKERFMKHFVPSEHLCYDESMIKYYGRHGCKQFIRGKPIRFGYKVWCLNTDYGYLLDFDVYQGKNPLGNTKYEEYFGKAAAPLIQMLDGIPEDKSKYPYKIYFDNLFTGFNLLVHLKERGYLSTGTLRRNRLPKDCPIANIDEMKKKERGTFKSILEKKDGILICRWKDNAVVTTASTAHGLQPVSLVQRYSSSDKRNIYVPQPFVINKYNKHMGGTDRMDEDIGQYRISIRGKKWWWSIFTWIIDAAVNNAWQLYRKSSGPITKLEFKREIVQVYLTRYKTFSKSRGGSSFSGAVNRRVFPEIRFDRLDHFVVETSERKRRRCVGDCKSVIRTCCEKCGVALCIKCFAQFHKKK